MKLQRRNLQEITYALYEGKQVIVGDDGYETGEKGVTYSAPVSLKCSVSPAMGTAMLELFGNLDNYDRVIITDKLDCPIDEESILFIDIPAQSDPATGAYLYNYVVKRVAKSLNFIAYAVSKVDLSAYAQNVLAIDTRTLYAQANGRRARAWVIE